MRIHQPLQFLLPVLATLVGGCVVGDPAQAGDEATDEPSDQGEVGELPASAELPDTPEELTERGIEHTAADEDGVGQLDASGNWLANAGFESSVYYTGSNYLRWRVYKGVVGNSVARNVVTATAFGTNYGLKLSCVDLCFAKQRFNAVPGWPYYLNATVRGYQNDGSPRQRVALWFYDQDLHWLGGKHAYVEDTSGAFKNVSVFTTAPANSAYVVVEVMYDSDTNERSRFLYDSINVF
jgi:hypothetical protein